MATRFLSGERILTALREANAAHTARRLAVAYWGAGAVERLGLESDLSDTRVICDLWSEGCNADAVLDLIGKGAHIRTVEGFHAKTYLYPDRVVLGSANASRGGLGAEDEPPTRTETALWCNDAAVLEEASSWFKTAWLRGTPVDAVMVKAARGELAAIRDARRTSLLHTLVHEPKPFDGLDVYVTLYEDGAVSKEAEQTWDIARGKYGADDRAAYEARGEWPFYEVAGDQLDNCPEGRIYLDFTRGKKGKPTFNGIWKVRTDGHEPVGDTGRFLVLLDRLPSIHGRRVVDAEMKAFAAALATFSSDDRAVGSAEIREAARQAFQAAAKQPFGK